MSLSILTIFEQSLSGFIWVLFIPLAVKWLIFMLMSYFD